MICPNAYYETELPRAKLNCKVIEKETGDKPFGNHCPFIYWCNISERFENTADIANCIKRGCEDE